MGLTTTVWLLRVATSQLLALLGVALIVAASLVVGMVPWP